MDRSERGLCMKGDNVCEEQGIVMWNLYKCTINFVIVFMFPLYRHWSYVGKKSSALNQRSEIYVRIRKNGVAV